MVLEPVMTLVPWPPNAEWPPAKRAAGVTIIAADSKNFLTIDLSVSLLLMQKD